MNQVISGIIELIKIMTRVAVFGLTITILANELKLATLKKISQGSVKLSTFTQQMTKK